MTSQSGRPVIYLVGTAGHPNYGDEVIASSWLRLVAERYPEADVWLDTPRPGQTAVLMDGLHPRLRCTDTLYHACWNTPGEDAAAAADWARQVLATPHVLPKEVLAVQRLAEVDLVVIMGGGYINGIWPKNYTLLAMVAAMAERHGTKVALSGGGLTPAPPGAEGIFGDLLGGFGVVDVRDQASFDLVKAAGEHVTHSGDDAFLRLPDLPVDRTNPFTHVLCLQEVVDASLEDDLIERPVEDVVDYAVRTLDAWGATDEPVVLLECLPPSDGAAYRLLKPHLPRLSVRLFEDLWRDGLPVKLGQRWISTRFHPHLLAAAAGAWGVAIPNAGDYYDTKHASLTSLGSGWAVAEDLEEPVPAGKLDGPPYGGRMGEIVAGKQAVAERILGLLES